VAADPDVRKKYLGWHTRTLRENTRLKDANEGGL
jgi:hypothetical protein